MNIIPIIILIINTINLSNITKSKPEKTLPITVVFTIILIYICGLLNNLRLGIYLIIVITIISTISIIYFIIKNKNLKEILKKTITPGIILYILLNIANIIINKGRILKNYDEFNHWGLITKNMYIYNQFGMHENSIIKFNEYPPFTAIFQYFFLFINKTYSEDIIIIAQNTLYISLIMPILENIEWNKNIKQLVLIIPTIFIPILFYGDFFEEILVDGFLGVVFAIGLYQIYNKQTKNQDLLLIAYITTLGLTKTTGIILAIILIFAKVKQMHTEKANKSYKRKIYIMILIPVVLVAMWYLKLGLFKANTNWDFKKVYIKQESESIENKIILKNFCKAFFENTNGLTEKNINNLVIFILYVTYIVCLYSKVPNEKKKKYIYCNIVIIITGIIYTLGLLLMYLTIFDKKEAIILASYKRYIGTIILSGFLFNTYVLISEFKVNLNKILIMISIISIFSPFKDIQEKYINANNYKKMSNLEMSEYKKIENYKDIFEKGDKIYYLVCQGEVPEYNLRYVRYIMMPICIGNSKVYDFEKKQDFINELKREGYTYLYVYKVDGVFKQKYKNMFENSKVLSYTLYKIRENENDLYFEKVD